VTRSFIFFLNHNKAGRRTQNNTRKKGGREEERERGREDPKAFQEKTLS